MNTQKIDTGSSTIERKYCHPHGQQYQLALAVIQSVRNEQISKNQANE